MNRDSSGEDTSATRSRSRLFGWALVVGLALVVWLGSAAVLRSFIVSQNEVCWEGGSRTMSLDCTLDDGTNANRETIVHAANREEATVSALVGGLCPIVTVLALVGVSSASPREPWWSR